MLIACLYSDGTMSLFSDLVKMSHSGSAISGAISCKSLIGSSDEDELTLRRSLVTSEDVGGKKELSEYKGFGELVMLSSDIQADGVLDQLPYLRKNCRK